ncbi:Serine/threonine-protein kinase RIO1 [Taphrina deformans PYCC 5710]|uniref:Serine/threonine-protein kinase RIO1 n=1 Tax=Taphrina deformans (strain PYCC 5710 / ATCC 11124 / CBS 356.35 / IMI 108563 / JCM 9778 / NBRC 8474) TaxID=1097556 RepID=R4XBS2_TAPDE|nr:Serine/threonine-protein kinase RIO1 [Taphrina deformans PYCC 5710]|eukprot:CCG80783.1 Serine/threonine-protein kinase RIO1 [Taphrina deformans PYCC 5710]
MAEHQADGQFSDAPAARDPSYNYLDESMLPAKPLATGSPTNGAESLDQDEDVHLDEEEEEEDSESEFEGQWDNDLDAGWDGSRGDFTKSYDRQKAMLQAQNDNKNVFVPKFNPSATRATVAEKAAAEGNTEMLAKLASRININSPAEKSLASNKDKSDRATSEQVLDPRTRIILLKLINNGVMHSISGCISTGKEANVYHAVTEDGKNLAVKIYKTSILVFKDRDKYVSGEYRFRQGYSKSNPRKMVKLWAEKEMRNLKRLYQAGIPCPEPLTLRSHVLVMTFLGSKDGWASCKLKDAELTQQKTETLYYRLMGFIRKLWQVCHLVHADLSEYNILYHKGDIFIIDVSQSVEHEHPRSLEFLRMDIKNCTDFFKKSGIDTCNERSVFEFVTAEDTTNEMDEMVTTLKDLPRGGDDTVDDQVFRQAYIPQNLDQVYDFERDGARIERGEGADLIYQNLVKLPDPKAVKSEGARAVGQEEKKVSFGMPDLLQNATEHENEFSVDAPAQTSGSTTSDSEPDSADEEGEEEEGDDGDAGRAYSDEENVPPARLKRFQDKDEKAERKKQVKAEKAEKRTNKMPKHLKKLKVKKTSKKK